VSNMKDNDVTEGIRCFLYDRCSIEEVELKWMVSCICMRS
jgi:hypothetical protein